VAGKPETFDYPGFTHICGKNGKMGYFAGRRKTVRKWMRAKLQAREPSFDGGCEPIAETGKWLRKVVRGYCQYHGVPRNIAGLGVFRERFIRMWRDMLRRRSRRPA
jgi:hypothetical protein